MIFAIVVLAFVALMASLWMVYNYINNIRTSDIHRTMLHDAVFQSRYQELRRQIGGEVGPSPETEWRPSAEEIERARDQLIQDMAGRQRYIENLKASSQAEDSALKIQDQESILNGEKARLETELSETKINERRKAEKEREIQRKEEEGRREIESKERDAKIRQQAMDETGKLVPPSLTIAGMGITGSFFIELTAILTIIFGVIILGLVGVLVTEQIAPLLAAIAGYVLGKTTNGWAPYGQLPSTPQPQSQSQPQIPSTPTQPGAENPSQHS
jgi:hypothetical protein